MSSVYFLVLLGCLFGESLGRGRNAICILNGEGVSGTINFSQERYGRGTRITGEISGLSPGNHGFHVHQYGDLSNGCTSTGGHYNPFNRRHGGPNDPARNRHFGDLGNVVANGNGVARVDITDRLVHLFGFYSVLGRAIVVHADRDDLGRGTTPGSGTTGNAGARLACCIIGFSQN